MLVTPGPSSATQISSWRCPTLQLTSTRPPVSSAASAAFRMRLMSSCSSWSASARTDTGGPSRTRTGIRFSSAATRFTQSVTSSSRSCGGGSRASLVYALMKRISPSARRSMTARPASTSSGAEPFRLLEMLWMGASELLISCPSTRTRRCQARRSSSLSARLRSVSTRSWWGSPPILNVLRRTSNRPLAPGRLNSITRGDSPARASSSRSRPASSPPDSSSCDRGMPSNFSAARFARAARPCASKASTATSISSITRRRSAPASSEPTRWACRVSASWLISSSSSPSGSPGRASRPRTEKSSSRSAAIRFAAVCRGRKTRSRSVSEVSSHTTTTSAPTVQPTFASSTYDRSKSSVASTPGAPAASESRKTC